MKSQASPGPQRLEWTAFALLLAIVLARCMMPDRLREPFQVTPQSEAAPRSPGPAASIGLDLLSCIPALLILLRRSIDQKFQIALPRSLIPLALLDLWMLASTFWASDKFAALVTACHWTTASIVLWTAIQLCRDWVKLRFLVAALVGLLAVWIISGLEFRFVEWPTTLQQFEQHKNDWLKDANLEPGSFAAIQFEKKVKLGELFGYFDSPNTFGSVISLVLVLTVGQLLQLFSEPTKRPWSVATLIVLSLAGLAILLLTRSRGAMTTFALALVGLALLKAFQPSLAAFAKNAYWIGVAVVVLALAAVMGHGLYHHSLPTSTLTFRWQYWVGAASLFRKHPLIGVGSNNFGLFYLAHRLPQAPEEIKDPHNFLVRFLTELGAVGGVLLIAWLLRLWWELTRPKTPEQPPPTTKPGVINLMATIAACALAIWFIAGVDWAREPFETYLLRLLFFGAIILASSLAALRSIHSQEPDGTPAPWILTAILLAIGGMFVHNLIDFSMFETGPMMLLFLLIGSALGMRQPPLPARKPGGRLALTLAAIVWLIALLALWIPIVRAEQYAGDADDEVRASHLPTAAQLYLQANEVLHGLNSDYIYQAGRISPPPLTSQRFAQAISQNPANAIYYFDAARAEAQSNPSDAERIRRDYQQGLALDPDNVAARLEYADTLAHLDDPTEARKQYLLALDYNDRLNLDEAKRLSPQQLAKVRKKLDLLPKP